MRHRVVMVTSSYPRFPGDAIATFMEPIAHGLASRGHDVHIVAPWHPDWRREPSEGNVRFHLFRYAPVSGLNVFGYAAGLSADVSVRASAMAVAPLAVVAAWRRVRQVVRETEASIVHAHWIVPGGVIGAVAAGGRPLVVSLHGSDVFVAERYRLVRTAARAAFRRASWVAACSADLGNRAVALGADADRLTVVPYGVDSERFQPDPAGRPAVRGRLNIPQDAPLMLAVGRLVKKKGFEYLIEAAARLKDEYPALRLVVAGDGDLRAPLRAQAATAGIAERVHFLGTVPHQDVPALLAAADVAVAPSVHDEAGNVDGLPNTVMEMLASGTPLVTTPVGGIGVVAVDGETARIVPERDAAALAAAIGGLLREPSVRATIGRQARDLVCRDHAWGRTAEAYEAIYNRVAR